MFYRSQGIVLGLVLLLAPLSASARDIEAGKRAFKKAETHYSIGEFKSALRSYRAAFKADPHPEFLFNIGQCLRKLGRYREALFHYQQYILKKPQAANREDVKKLIEICEAHLRDADRTRDSKSDGKRGQDDTRGGDSKPSPPTQKGPTTRDRVLLWSGIGTSAALLVTSAITGGIALAKSNDYNDPTTSLADRRALRDSGTPLRTVHYTTLAVGAAGAVATVLYYFLHYRKQGGIVEEPGAQVGVLGSSTGARLVVGGRF